MSALIQKKEILLNCHILVLHNMLAAKCRKRHNHAILFIVFRQIFLYIIARKNFFEFYLKKLFDLIHKDLNNKLMFLDM